jgi:hypothetical protein
MSPETICPRCGHRNSFTPARLPGTCVCQVCLSQLDWRSIPGVGPDCAPLPDSLAAPSGVGEAPAGGLAVEESSGPDEPPRGLTEPAAVASEPAATTSEPAAPAAEPAAAAPEPAAGEAEAPAPATAEPGEPAAVHREQTRQES